MAVPASSVGRVMGFGDDLIACYAYVSLAVQLHQHIFHLQCDYLCWRAACARAASYEAALTSNIMTSGLMWHVVALFNALRMPGFASGFTLILLFHRSGFCGFSRGKLRLPTG